MNDNCTEIGTIKQFKKRVMIFYLCCHRVIQKLLRKSIFGLDESNNRTIFDIEDGINSKDVPLLVVEVDFQAESAEDSSWTLGK